MEKYDQLEPRNDAYSINFMGRLKEIVFKKRYAKERKDFAEKAKRDLELLDKLLAERSSKKE